MISFDGIPFKVATPDGRLPLPESEEDSGIEYYTAEILIDNRVDYLALKVLRCVVTPRPAQGIYGGGIAMIDSGPGYKSLVYPDGDQELTTDAILLGWKSRSRIGADVLYRVEARWLFVEVPD